MRKYIISTSIIMLFAVSLIPFKSTFVPEWELRVTDENGTPYKGKPVRQFCDSYSLGMHPCQESDDFMQNTDENGYVHFSEKKINASLVSRLVRLIINFVLQIAHGSFGASVYVDSTGPTGLKRLEYVSGKPLPHEFVLPSKDFENEN